MAERKDIIMRLSGGAGNADPNLSLGGVISTASQIASQSVVFDGGGVAGVTLNEALGHATPGVGTLDFTLTGTLLQWTPPGAGAQGAGVDVSIDGDYLIPAAPDNEYVLVTVVAASLPGGDTSDTATVASEVDAFFDVVGNVEAALGDIEYRCFYILNDAGAGDALNVKIWITMQPGDSGTMLAIGVDPAGVNGTAVTVADEDTAPVGPVFTAPVTEGTAIIVGNLTPGDFAAVWVRRTVPTNELASETDDKSELTIGVSF